MTAPPVQSVPCRNPNLYGEAVAWHGRNLTHLQRLLATALRDRSKWDGPDVGLVWHMTLAQVAEFGNTSERRTKDAIAALVARGWLLKEPGARVGGAVKPTPRYRLSIPADAWAAIQAGCQWPHHCQHHLRGRASVATASVPELVTVPREPALAFSGGYAEPPF